VTDLYSVDIRDGIQWPRIAVERHPEIAGARLPGWNFGGMRCRPDEQPKQNQADAAGLAHDRLLQKFSRRSGGTFRRSTAMVN
jgi:hypothetical protein